MTLLDLAALFVLLLMLGLGALRHGFRERRRGR